MTPTPSPRSREDAQFFLSFLDALAAEEEELIQKSHSDFASGLHQGSANSYRLTAKWLREMFASWRLSA